MVYLSDISFHPQTKQISQDIWLEHELLKNLDLVE